MTPHTSGLPERPEPGILYRSSETTITGYGIGTFERHCDKLETVIAQLQETARKSYEAFKTQEQQITQLQGEVERLKQRVVYAVNRAHIQQQLATNFREMLYGCADEREKQTQQIATLTDSIERLTPGGSEYVGDMDACIGYLVRRMGSVGMLAKERNELREQVTTLTERLKRARADALEEAAQEIEVASLGEGSEDVRVGNELADCFNQYKAGCGAILADHIRSLNTGSES